MCCQSLQSLLSMQYPEVIVSWGFLNYSMQLSQFLVFFWVLQGTPAQSTQLKPIRGQNTLLNCQQHGIKQQSVKGCIQVVTLEVNAQLRQVHVNKHQQISKHPLQQTQRFLKGYKAFHRTGKHCAKPWWELTYTIMDISHYSGSVWLNRPSLKEKVVLCHHCSFLVQEHLPVQPLIADH